MSAAQDVGNPVKGERALVVFSGGQDSTTCLYWALRCFQSVETITFDYGQRHRIELDAVAAITKFAGVPSFVLKETALSQLGGNALTSELPVIAGSDGELPTTFVPGRNILFLTLAAAYAYQRGIAHLVTGVCQTDYSGYPDCRRETIDSIERTLALGMGRPFAIHTPLMWLTKRETVELAVEVGAMKALGFSHTCYNGVAVPCGVCPACELRAKGFAEAGIEDPLVTRCKLEGLM